MNHSFVLHLYNALPISPISEKKETAKRLKVYEGQHRGSQNLVSWTLINRAMYLLVGNAYLQEFSVTIHH